jgi:uncharacterized membrane protein
VDAPRAPGILLGIGLGGLFDGIVFHQILGWHHLISEKTDSTRANTLADGLFHAAVWVVVAVGIWLLWRRAAEWRWAGSGRALAGWILVGWGGFNLVEGLVDHQLLGLHHVREDTLHRATYDLAFLTASAALVLAGLTLARRAEPAR